jgi:uncharacterized membrane protein YgcG
MTWTVRTLAALAATLATGALAPAASASIAPTLKVTQSGSQAGSPIAFGTDITFNPSNGDSVKNLTLSLPPGLLSNAAIDGGACLKSTAALSACQVGTGTLKADPVVLGQNLPTPTSVPITLTLVAPPHSGDLAGLMIRSSVLGQLGTPGAVAIVPNGAGQPTVQATFTNIPNSLPGLSPAQIAITELQTTLTGTRLPTSCGTPSVAISADSYGGTSGASASQTLSVTGCSSLPFTPKLSVTAVKDSADSGVTVITDVTQPATPAQATPSTVALTLPTGLLSPNAAAVISGGVLCTNPTLSGCTPIGSATSVSPLYPVPLTGRAYLTGSLAALHIELVFPAPFPITLTGSVNIATNTTTFTGVPDLPLTDLKVTLAGGPNAVFMTSCNTTSGSAVTTETPWSGEPAVTATAPVSLAGCLGSGGSIGGSGPGSGGSGGPGGGSGGSGGSGGPTLHGGTPPAKPGQPRLTRIVLAFVGRGAPVLRFHVLAGSKAPAIRTVTVTLPGGLHFHYVRLHGRRTIVVQLFGAKLRSVRLVRGHLLITLRRPARSFVVRLPGLGESATLRRHIARRRLGTLRLRIAVTDAARARTSFLVTLR